MGLRVFYEAIKATTWHCQVSTVSVNNPQPFDPASTSCFVTKCGSREAVSHIFGAQTREALDIESSPGQRLILLDEAQTAVDVELVNPDDLDADLDEASNFRKAATNVRFEVTMRMKRVNDGSDSDKGSVSSMSTSDAKLPKLELPKYDGDLTQWQSFWDRFTASIDRTDIPVITKFTYLQSVLQGKALSAIRGVTLTVLNYKVACDILKNRFGRPQIIINAHIHALMNISVAPKIRGANYVESLCESSRPAPLACKKFGELWH
ncbi:uncharacterized protein [Penaeus vannamei]|uniref:uncharacterized protein n=1 Tax=Penaeus vannamei TaxID=6689 RepID=UPI00387F626C